MDTLGFAMEGGETANLEQSVRALVQRGRIDEAHQKLTLAIHGGTKVASVYHARGGCAMALGRPEDAVADFKSAVALAPHFVPGWTALGDALSKVGAHELALVAHHTALELAPEDPTLHFNLGCAHVEHHTLEDAQRHFREALSRREGYLDAELNLAHTLGMLNRHVEAIDGYRKVLAQAPNHAHAHWNLSQSLLSVGQTRRGFLEYEWRRALPTANLPKLSRPWDGQSSLEGTTFLIRGEQGAGDHLQFIRLARNLKRRGARRVVASVFHSLVNILADADDIDEVWREDAAPPAYDFECLLLSLPMLLAQEGTELWGATPYLRPHAPCPDAIARTITDDGRLRVGLVWRGSPQNPNDWQRSTDLATMAPLIDLPHTRFFSLQAGVGSDQVGTPYGSGLVDLAPWIADFRDTAHALCRLDVLVTIDSSVAHLAGALGVPTIMIPPFSGEWRWGTAGSVTELYASMRIVRPPRPRGFDEPIAEVGRLLRAMAADPTRREAPQAGG